MNTIKNITPLGEHLLVFFEEKEKESSGGLLLSATAQKKPEICEIVKVGTGVNNMQLKAGTKVLINHYAGTDIKINSTSFALVLEKDIIAIVEEV